MPDKRDIVTHIDPDIDIDDVATICNRERGSLNAIVDENSVMPPYFNTNK